VPYSGRDGGTGAWPATFGTRGSCCNGRIIRGVKLLRRASSPRERATPPDRAACRVEPLPRSQHQMVDWLGLMHRQHTVHALLEVDVTDARQAIREHRARTSAGLSFTAFIVANLARAVDEDRRMHAYRRGRSELVVFDDVDVTVLVGEAPSGGRVERIEVREMLALTVSVDHDVIDGAPAARFGARLAELIEGAAGLD
jgi:chloramphenicol O-acetyltransferase